jgi:hypothetical protein
VSEKFCMAFRHRQWVMVSDTLRLGFRFLLK